MIKPKQFRVSEGEKVKLSKWPTDIAPVYESETQYQELLKAHVDKLSSLQQLLYASDRYSLLLIFQAMDTAGKDGVIRHVMSGVNPQGTQVYSFKQPSASELDHDFLWRTTQCLPERGRIGVFNRSYYEEVLVVRVHPELLDAQRLPKESLGKEIWSRRFKSIRDFEKHLFNNGTRVLKFYLHLSKDEQRKRFLARIDDPEKNWKFSAGDVTERSFWNKYMSAYENCLQETSTAESPWFVVPADDKQNARLIISKIILDTLGSLKMSYPEVSPTARKELQRIRKQLAK